MKIKNIIQGIPGNLLGLEVNEDSVNKVIAYIKEKAGLGAGNAEPVEKHAPQIFEPDGTIGLEEETFSKTKKQILERFKKNVYDSRFTKAVEECLVDYKNDTDEISFTKEELKLFKNKNLIGITDENAMKELQEKELDMTVAEDRRELLKRLMIIMYHMEKQSEGQDGALPTNGLWIILGWVKLTSGKQCVLYFHWFSVYVAWRLDAFVLDDWGDDGNCFFSRKALKSLGH